MQASTYFHISCNLQFQIGRLCMYVYDANSWLSVHFKFQYPCHFRRIDKPVYIVSSSQTEDWRVLTRPYKQRTVTPFDFRSVSIFTFAPYYLQVSGLAFTSTKCNKTNPRIVSIAIIDIQGMVSVTPAQEISLYHAQFTYRLAYSICRQISKVQTI